MKDCKTDKVGDIAYLPKSLRSLIIFPNDATLPIPRDGFDKSYLLWCSSYTFSLTLLTDLLTICPISFTSLIPIKGIPFATCLGALWLGCGSMILATCFNLRCSHPLLILGYENNYE